MFTVFQFFNLILYEIFQTTASIGPFTLPHAVCVVIVTIFVSAIFATDDAAIIAISKSISHTPRNVEDTFQSDNQIVHVVDPPTNSGPRTPSSTRRSHANSNALPTKIYKLHTPYFQQPFTPINPLKTSLSSNNPRIQSADHRRPKFFLLENSRSSTGTSRAKTRTSLPTAKLKAPNSSCFIILNSSLPTLMTYDLLPTSVNAKSF